MGEVAFPVVRLISLNPELKDHFGHYLAYDRVLRKEFARRGVEFVSFASKKVDPEIGGELEVVPTFVKNSWRAYSERTLVDWWRCARDFSGRVKRAIVDLDPPEERNSKENVFFMYLADVRHVVAALWLSRSLPGKNTFVLNLFWSHFTHGAPPADRHFMFRALFRLTRALRRRARVFVVLDSEILARQVEAETGERFRLLPMFSVTNFSSLEEREKPGTSESVPRVVYAGNMRFPKGYDLVCELARDWCRSDAELVVRRVVVGNTDRRLVTMSEHLRRATVVEGILEPAEYSALLDSADVLLLPYRVSEFRSRTSGIFADAMVLGKPMVGTQGTWLGERIEQYGCGTTFPDGDLQGLQRAVDAVLADLPEYRRRVGEARLAWLRRNNPVAAVDFILGHAEEPRSEATR